jgi:two-component system, NarL family, response regulator LiaR
MNSSKKTTIALIDDHEIVRLGLGYIINAESDLTVVSQSGDAQSGLDKILALRPDVAIVDISMPGVSGFEMVKVARQQVPTLKVIFLTAYNSAQNLELALASGAAGFVTKGESLGSIVTAIREAVLGHTPYLSRDIRTTVVSAPNIADALSAANRSIPEGALVGRVGTTPLKTKHTSLSPREQEILCCVAQGQSAKQIANNLSISSKTVERHKSNIMAKLHLHNQVDLTRFAIREGLITA